MTHRTNTLRHGIRGVVVLAAVAILLNACSKSSDPAPRGRDLANQPFPTKAAPQSDNVKIPWELIRINKNNDRVSLSASTHHQCVRPSFAVVLEHADQIAISVYGRKSTTSPSDACNASRTTLVGYVEVRGGMRTRPVVHG